MKFCPRAAGSRSCTFIFILFIYFIFVCTC